MHGIEIVDARGPARAHDRGAECVRPRFDGEHETRRPAAAEEPNPLAVHRDLDRVVAADGRQPEAAAGTAHADLVLRIERKYVTDEDAAARAERHTVEMLGLGKPARRRIGRDPRTDRGVADREPADLCRGRHIGLHVRRRDAERARDIVKSVARVVAG